MKKRILNLLWRIQFKKTVFLGKKGYHCVECAAGNKYCCGDFYCPLEGEPYGKLIWRFKNDKFIKLINKWRISIS